MPELLNNLDVNNSHIGCGDGGNGDDNDDGGGNNSANSAETTDPSSVSFSSATYQVTENDTSITITVNRAGDTAAAISVDYAASNGTAVDGEDFSVTSGTLNWEANDNTKTFDVQVISDNATEGDETVELALSSPSENTNLGSNTTAVLTISDVVMAACNGEITDQNITVDTTLSESCYKVPNGISVSEPAKLTISPGVRLEFSAGTQLVVNNSASLRYASDLGMSILNDVVLNAFENNTLTLNNRPISLPAERVGELDKESQYSGNTDDRIHIHETVQDVVTA